MTDDFTILDYVDKLTQHDTTLTKISIFNKQCTSSDVMKLVDCLLKCPNNVYLIDFTFNIVPVDACLALVRLLTVNSTITIFSLTHVSNSIEVIVAVATALHVNSSLRRLFLGETCKRHKTYIDQLFANALRLNPVRPEYSHLEVCAFKNRFDYFKSTAEKMAPPSMLEFLLCIHSESEKNKSKIH